MEGVAELEKNVSISDMLSKCDPYVHRDYDGDPATAIGAASLLSECGIAGVAHIMPFTCMPGTLLASAASSFRKDHRNIPWIDIDYDGQEDTGIDTRLQAFMYQSREYAQANGSAESIHEACNG